MNATRQAVAPTSEQVPPLPDVDECDFGVALSGGGVRASLFSLGVLIYLVHSRLNERVRAITSVSGGSITNAVLAAAPQDFAKSTATDINAVSERLASRLAKQGSFFLGGMKRFRFVVMGLGGFYAVVAGYLFLGSDLPVMAAIALSLAVGGGVAALALGYAYFLNVIIRRKGQEGTYASLLDAVHSDTGPWQRVVDSSKRRNIDFADLPESSVWHVLCATELNSGQPLFFSKQCVYSPAYGWSDEHKIALAAAVYASAALPLAFPPGRIRASRLRLAGGNRVIQRPKTLLLADGGSYNNLGNDWFNWMKAARQVQWGLDEKVDCPPDINHQIVVNASAIPRVASLPRWWPYRNVIALLRTSTILYENTVRPRIDELRGQVRKGDVTVIDISRTPLELARLLENEAEHDEVKKRARDIGDELEKGLARELWNDRYWNDLVDMTALVKTTLAPLGRERSSALLRHGYLNAMVACHARFDSAGVEEAPSTRWFDDLTEKASGKRSGDDSRGDSENSK